MRSHTVFTFMTMHRRPWQRRTSRWFSTHINSGRDRCLFVVSWHSVVYLRLISHPNPSFHWPPETPFHSHNSSSSNIRIAVQHHWLHAGCLDASIDYDRYISGGLLCMVIGLRGNGWPEIREGVRGGSSVGWLPGTLQIQRNQLTLNYNNDHVLILSAPKEAVQRNSTAWQYAVDERRWCFTGVVRRRDVDWEIAARRDSRCGKWERTSLFCCTMSRQRLMVDGLFCACAV